MKVRSGKKRFQVTYNSTEQNDLLHWLAFNQAYNQHVDDIVVPHKQLRFLARGLVGGMVVTH